MLGIIFWILIECRICLFMEVSAMENRFNNYADNLAKASHLSYLISGGPVVYFNTSVGIEFTLGWSYEKAIEDKSSAQSFLMGLGLQVHLER